MLRSRPARTDMKPACGPPKPKGTPSRCAEPTTTSAPSSPGGVRSVSASRSVVTMARAPRSCADGDDGGEVAHAPGGAGVADQDARHAVGRQVAVEVGDDERDAQRLGSRVQDREGLRVRVGVDDDHGGAGLRRAQRERHRLGSRGGLVEQGGAGHGKGREVLDHRLEVEQRLEAALRDLRLVRRVRRVPGRVLEDVARDHAGRVRAVVAQPDHAGDDAVACGQIAQLGQGRRLGRGLGQVQRLVPPDDLRDHVGREGLEVGVAEQPEHACLLVSVGTDVPGGELHAHDAPQGPGMPGHTRVNGHGRDRSPPLFPTQPRDLRASPGGARLSPSVGIRSIPLSRGASPERSWCLRGCRGDCSFGALVAQDSPARDLSARQC